MKNNHTTRDVSHQPDEVAVTELVTFGGAVSTAAGRIEPSQDGFTLSVEGRRPRRFATAAPAVRNLRRVSQ